MYLETFGGLGVSVLGWPFTWRGKDLKRRNNFFGGLHAETLFRVVIQSRAGIMASDNKKQCSLGLSALVTTPFSGNWQFFTTGNPKRNCCPLLPRDDPHGTTLRYFCVVCP